MKRAACAGGLLLLCGWLQVRAGTHGAAFSYRGIENGEAILIPMTPPRVGVQLAKGVREINKAETLVCTQDTVKHKSIVDGLESEVTELRLKCGDREFIVKGLYFEEF